MSPRRVTSAWLSTPGQGKTETKLRLVMKERSLQPASECGQETSHPLSPLFLEASGKASKKRIVDSHLKEPSPNRPSSLVRSTVSEALSS